MRTMIERCEVVGRTHVDVGAADGKVLLGALSLGAAHVYGVEISGDGLQTKFEGLRDVLAQSHSMGASSARLACSIDICDLRGATVEAWLNEVFNESDDTEITVSAVWHGYVCPSSYLFDIRYTGSTPRPRRRSSARAPGHNA